MTIFCGSLTIFVARVMALNKGSPGAKLPAFARARGLGAVERPRTLLRALVKVVVGCI